VSLLGLDWKTSAAELRQRIGVQLQETQFPEKLTVEEILRLFRSFFKRGTAIEETIRMAQLEEKRGARVGTLSGGQKQRLAMACALVGDPDCCFSTSQRPDLILRRDGICGIWSISLEARVERSF